MAAQEHPEVDAAAGSTRRYRNDVRSAVRRDADRQLVREVPHGDVRLHAERQTRQRVSVRGALSVRKCATLSCSAAEPAKLAVRRGRGRGSSGARRPGQAPSACGTDRLAVRWRRTASCCARGRRGPCCAPQRYGVASSAAGQLRRRSRPASARGRCARRCSTGGRDRTPECSITVDQEARPGARVKPKLGDALDALLVGHEELLEDPRVEAASATARPRPPTSPC